MKTKKEIIKNIYIYIYARLHFQAEVAGNQASEHKAV